ncbi:MAG: TadE/TadG family type IV pilus assembly protein [Roseburia sp.]
MKKRLIKEETGAVFVEASIVFPVMFFVIFILIYMGNAFYVRSCVDSVVTKTAVRGAAYCADPLLYNVMNNGVPMTAANLSVKPYSSIAGNGEAMSVIESELDESLSQIGCGFFSGMAPVYSASSVKYNNYLVCSNVTIQVDYTIKFPIRFIGSDEPIALEIHSKCVQPVNDTPTFIRNIDMVKDYMDAYGVTDWINDKFSKVKEFFDSFGMGD